MVDKRPCVAVIVGEEKGCSAIGDSDGEMIIGGEIGKGEKAIVEAWDVEDVVDFQVSGLLRGI